MIINVGLNNDINSADNAIFFIDVDKKFLLLRYFEKAIIPKIILNIDGMAPRKVKNNAYMEYPY